LKAESTVKNSFSNFKSDTQTAEQLKHEKPAKNNDKNKDQLVAVITVQALIAVILSLFLVGALEQPEIAVRGELGTPKI
jgi:hypothetical protein